MAARQLPADSVLLEYIRLSMTDTEIAKACGVTRQAVSQVRNRLQCAAAQASPPAIRQVESDLWRIREPLERVYRLLCAEEEDYPKGTPERLAMWREIRATIHEARETLMDVYRAEAVQEVYRAIFGEVNACAPELRDRIYAKLDANPVLAPALTGVDRCQLEQ